jgi:tetratricopeptide (TPR) repeat protein
MPADVRGLAAVIFLATMLVYAPVVEHDFVNWDDPEYVVRNPVVSSGLTSIGLTRAFTHAHGATWHPLTSLSHMLDCELFGLWAGGHHLVSAALHATAAVLLLGLLTAMTGATGPSAFAAGVFALHPLRVESVAWASERKDVLAAVFWMLTLWAYVGWARRPGARRYALLVAAFALGLMAKPMVVTAPLVLLLLDRWPLGRVVPLRRRVREKLVLFALAAVVSTVTFVVQQQSSAVASLEKIGLADRVANAIFAYGWYVAATLWPTDLAVFYPLQLPIQAWQVASAGALLAGVSVLAWLARRSRPWLLVGWLWFVVTLMPVIGLVRVGEQAVADRYTYLPGIGLSIMAAWSAADLARGRPRLGAAFAVGTVAVLVAFAAASRAQLAYWRDDVALYERALAVTRDNHVAHTNLGVALLERGRVADAFPHLQETLRLKPNASWAHGNLGNALAARGDRAAALAAYARALELDHGNAGVRAQLADLLAGEGRLAEAIAQYREAAVLAPDSPRLHTNLGYLLATQGNLAEAVDHYRAALGADPDFAAAHNNLGLALERLGERAEALGHYAAAVRLAPADPRARVNYATALARAGLRPDAIVELREALRRRSDWQPARQELATLLAGDENPARRTEAVVLAEQLTTGGEGGTPEALSTLAVAYQGVGRLADALRTWDAAIAAARSSGRTDLLPPFETAAAACRARATHEPRGP